jgi:hypothetical protein
LIRASDFRSCCCSKLGLAGSCSQAATSCSWPGPTFGWFKINGGDYATCIRSQSGRFRMVAMACESSWQCSRRQWTRWSELRGRGAAGNKRRSGLLGLPFRLHSCLEIQLAGAAALTGPAAHSRQLLQRQRVVRLGLRSRWTAYPGDGAQVGGQTCRASSRPQLRSSSLIRPAARCRQLGLVPTHLVVRPARRG